MLFEKQGIALLLSFGLFAPAVLADDAPKPFELGIEQRDRLPDQPVPTYGAPQMVPTYTPPPPPKKPKKQKLESGVTDNAPPQRPLNGSAQMSPPRNMQPMMGQQAPVQQNVLPPQFLGRWQVSGMRSAVEALPQFQSGIDGIFSMQTNNIWNIGGNPQQGYMLSTDTGVQTSLMVETKGDTAILRYQHQIKNTMAQEALVMQLAPGGAQFEGLERITIVAKTGEKRAMVTYKLVGRRQ
ncbi:MAG: hypothetical protein K2X81_23955 [Candidatus Obscuribacterales bacterium]|nr:hypothetical protein [Candidatus Obscuribacterales bacterium]